MFLFDHMCPPIMLADVTLHCFDQFYVRPFENFSQVSTSHDLSLHFWKFQSFPVFLLSLITITTYKLRDRGIKRKTRNWLLAVASASLLKLCSSLAVTTALTVAELGPESSPSSPRMPRGVLQVEPPSPFNDELQAPSRNKSNTFLFSLGGIVVLIILLIVLFVFWKRIKGSAQLVRKTAPKTKGKQGKRNEIAEVMEMIFPAKQQLGSMEFLSGNLRTISYFDYQILRKATKNFSSANLLGSGGFGPVYRGKLVDGRLIALKKLSLNKSQQGEREFLAEVRLITSIQHKNLVRLLGCCIDGPQRILVYEYMENRSLDLFIYGNSDQFLNWSTRFQIILGVARGLQYLHEDSHLRIVHRDIKASNILLDDKFHPKIGDFGLARFFPEDQAYLSTQFAGTLGYTAPEYAIRGELSEKADIYSFGVLVLEIICCRKNTDRTLPSEMQYLPRYAWKLYENSKTLDLVDPKLQEHGIVEKDIMQAFHVAFLCLQPLADLRPPMSEIVALLTFKIEMVTTPMRPAFLDRRRKKDDEIHSPEAISQVFPSPMSHSQ